MPRCRLPAPPACTAVTAAVVLCAHGALAQGQSPALHLAWTAPAGCPTDTDARARIDRLTAAGRTSTPVGGTVTADVTLTRRSPTDPPDHAGAAGTGAGAWRMVLVTDRGGVHGERVLEDASCEALTDVAAVILALLVNPPDDTAPATVPVPATVSPRPSPPPALPAPPARTVPVEVPAPTEPVPAPAGTVPVHTPAPEGTSDGVPVRWVIGALVTGDLGSLPGGDAGVGMAVGGVWRRWRWGLRGSAWLTRRGDVSTDGSRGGTFGLYTGTALGCYAVVDGTRGGLDGCVTVEAGALRGAAVGVSSPGVTWEPWVAPGVEASLRMALGPVLGLRAGVGMAVPVVRPDFVITGVGPVFQPGAVVGRAVLGAEVTF